MEIKNVVVHSFELSDVEDPDIYAAEPIWAWQQTDSGKWVMKHAVEEPIWHRIMDPARYCYKYRITAKLTDKDYTFWCLKWPSIV